MLDALLHAWLLNRRRTRQRVGRELRFDTLEQRLAPALPGAGDTFARIGNDLGQLNEDYTAQVQSGALAPGAVYQPQNPLIRVVGDEVIVDIAAAANVAAVENDVVQMGGTVTGAADYLVSAFLPISALPQLDASTDVQFATPDWQPVTAAGAVESQGVKAVGADLAQQYLGYDGTGVKVGVLSDSFNTSGVGSYAADVASGDLPANLQVLQDFSGGTDEGRAMLQIVHDVAPGASLAFATADNGEASFANNIIALKNAGANVIADDVAYFAEPMFQDGVIAQAVDTVTAAGVSYFSAAGNEGNDSYSSAWRAGPVLAANSISRASGAPRFQGGTTFDFDPGPAVNDLQSFSLASGSSIELSFQWDSPFFSVSGGNGSLNDLDIYVLNSAGTQIVGGAATTNFHQDPVEVFEFTNNTSSTNTYNLMIVKRAETGTNPDPDIIKYVNFASPFATYTNVAFATNTGALFGHANAATATAVGAAYYVDTPAYGVSPPQLEFFSSQGSTPIYLSTTGTYLTTPITRNHPDVVGPDGVQTTFFDPDEDGSDDFFGTSAATPHVAGVAALMLQARPGTSPATINAALKSTATDMGTPGYDFATGSGLVNASSAIMALGGTFTLTLGAGTSANDGNADSFRIVQNGANYNLFANNTIVFSAPTSSVSQINVVGSNDADTLTVDETGGVISVPISFAGGAGTNNLIVQGGSFTTIVENLTAAAAGNIALTDSAGTKTVTYTGLASSLLAVTSVTALTLNLPTGADTAFLEDDTTANDNRSRLRSSTSTFPTTGFVDPSGSLAVNIGSGDNLTVSSLDAQYRAPLTISDGGAGSDTVSLSGALVLGGSSNPANLAVTAAAVNVSGSVTTNSGSVTFTNSGTLTFLSSATILNSGAVLQNGSGPVSLAGTITTTNAAINFTRAVTLGGAAALTGTSVTFGNTLSGAGDLTITGATTFQAAVGAVPLHSLTVNGTVALNTSSVATSGQQLYKGSVTLSLATTALSASLVDFEAPLALGTATINVTGNLQLGSSAALSTQIIGPAASQYGHLTRTGNLFLLSPPLSVVLGNGYIPAGGTIFDLVGLDSTGSIQSTFLNDPESTVVSGGAASFTLSYLGGAHAQDVILTPVSAPPVVTSVTANPTSINEGSAVTVTGSFTEADATSIHTVLIAWGDNTTSPATVTESGGNGTFSATHTYQNNLFGDAPYSITATVTDNHNLSATGSTTLVVHNVAPALTNLQASPATINEGDTATLTGNLTDPGVLDGHRLTMTWGEPGGAPSTFLLPATTSLSVGQTRPSTTDGASLTITAVNTTTGVVGFQVTHRYVDNNTPAGPFTIVVSAVDNASLSGSGSTTVTVNNAAPVVTPAAAQVANEGSLSNFNLGSFSDAGLNDQPWSVDVNWGDGSSDTTFTTTTQGGLSIQGHTYHTFGPQTVTVSVTDKDGGTGQGTFSVNVGDITPPVISGTPSDVSLEATGPSGAAYNYVMPTAQDPDNGPIAVQADDPPNTVFPLGATVVHFTATDASGNAATSSFTVTVVAPTLIVSGPANPIAGTAFSFSVTAVDASNAPTPYTGTLHFESSDGRASLPANTVLTNGTGSFTATLKTAGSQTLTATDTAVPAVTGTSDALVVIARSATHFSVIAPPTATIGVPVAVVVTARDPFNNVDTDYTGTVQLTATDTAASADPAATLTNGVGSFDVTFATSGNQFTTASDIDTGVQGTSNLVDVSAAPATHFQVSTSSTSIAAGGPLLVTVTALDATGHLASGYTGTVHFTSSDGHAVLPADTTLTAGVVSVPVTLTTAGAQTIAVTDTTALSGSTVQTVVAASPFRVSFAAPPTGTAIGNALPSLSVDIVDAYGNIVTSDNSDPVTISIAAGPGTFAGTSTTTATVTGGVATFTSLILNKPGAYSLDATISDAEIGPVFTSVTIDPLKLTGPVLLTPNGFVATFNTAINPNALQLYGTGLQATDDVVLSDNTAGTTIPGTLVIDPSDTKVTFIASGGFLDFASTAMTQSPLLPDGSYSLRLVGSGAQSFQDIFGNGLAGDGVHPGSDYNTGTTPLVVQHDATPTVYAPQFTQGPEQALTVWSDAELYGSDNGNQTDVGLPISITQGQGVTAGTVTLSYNPTLLTLTGGSGIAAPSSGITDFTVTIPIPGTALITFSGPGIPSNLPVTLGTIAGSVNATFNSAYGATDILHLTGLSLTGAASPGQTADGLHINILPGDANRNGNYDVDDSNDAGSVFNHLDTGFAAYPLIDPTLIADLNGQPDPINAYGVDAGDTSEILQAAAHLFPTFDIPAAPPIYTGTPGTAGPDLTVSIPTNLAAPAGGVVNVPVNIDTAQPASNTGLTQASLTIMYDPQALTVAPTDVSLGSVPLAGSGWSLITTVDASTGTIRIDVSSATPSASFTSGSLVTIDFHVNPAASGVSVINLGAATYLANAQGPLTLSPAPTDGQDPVDGSVTISADEAWLAELANSQAPTLTVDSYFASL